MPEIVSDHAQLFAALSAVLMVAGFIFAFISWHKVRVIEDTPTSRIRSAHQGFIELVGNAEKLGFEPLHAPITMTPCVWYRYKVEERGTGEGNTQAANWSTIQSGQSEAMFLLDDETGKCLIDPEGAQIIPTTRDVWYSDSSNSMTDIPLFTRKSKSFIFGGRYRFTEERIEQGDHLYVIGNFHSQSAEADMPTKEEALRELLNQWKKDRDMLLERFDANRDGKIDEQEWVQVRAAAQAQIAKEYNEAMLLPQYHIMNKPENKRQPYIISHLSEHEITRKHRWTAVGSLIGFFASGSFLVWVVMRYI